MPKKRVKPIVIRFVRPRLHEEITERQTEQIRTIYSTIGKPYCCATFEQFERGFLFVKDIDEELRWWSALAETYLECLRRFPKTDERNASIVTVWLSHGFLERMPGVSERAYRFLKSSVPLRASFCVPAG